MHWRSKIFRNTQSHTVSSLSLVCRTLVWHSKPNFYSEFCSSLFHKDDDVYIWFIELWYIFKWLFLILSWGISFKRSCHEDKKNIYIGTTHLNITVHKMRDNVFLMSRIKKKWNYSVFVKSGIVDKVVSWGVKKKYRNYQN